MLFIVLGIDHNTAPVEVRERVAFEPKSLMPALLDAQENLGHQGVAILSTCNRTELYLETDEPPERALEWMAKWHGLDRKNLEGVNYLMTDDEAASHLMKVASGLDSLILGEPQILGQLKSAYAVALDAGTLSSGLHRTFQQVFSTAKRIRSETAIGKNPVSVAYAAVSLARQIFSELESKTALLIGAGETIRLASQHLIQQGVSRLIIANRTLNNAQKLAEDLNVTAEAILLSDIPEYLHRADIVISSTASQLPILGKGAVESALKQRKHALMFMVDVAVPRDIEHEVDDLDDVYLFTVDDLSEVIEENRRSREEAAAEAAAIIEECRQQWVRDNRAARNVDLIKVFRNRSTEIRDQELQKALTALESGESANKVLERFAKNLTNKLIHHPTTELNKAISDDQSEVIGAAQRLFDLGDEQQD
ncbi:MAG: glutamyl-tRNA reductase [Porticoccaceae bacterium]